MFMFPLLFTLLIVYFCCYGVGMFVCVVDFLTLSIKLVKADDDKLIDTAGKVFVKRFIKSCPESIPLIAIILPYIMLKTMSETRTLVFADEEIDVG